MAGFEDVTLVCIDCGDVFTWTTADQEFHQRRRYPPPKRCYGCRDIRKAQRNQHFYGR